MLPLHLLDSFLAGKKHCITIKLTFIAFLVQYYLREPLKERAVCPKSANFIACSMCIPALTIRCFDDTAADPYPLSFTTAYVSITGLCLGLRLLIEVGVRTINEWPHICLPSPPTTPQYGLYVLCCSINDFGQAS